ncbi:hypothetical protein KY289_036527 [Solanum tuberosum]|nr:hypothetical protein KY289_036527 [Solanum tuberosum]
MEHFYDESPTYYAPGILHLSSGRKTLRGQTMFHREVGAEVLTSQISPTILLLDNPQDHPVTQEIWEVHSGHIHQIMAKYTCFVTTVRSQVTLKTNAIDYMASQRILSSPKEGAQGQLQLYLETQEVCYLIIVRVLICQD